MGTDQAWDVKIFLANPEPTTHGTYAKCRPLCNCLLIGASRK
jgi:hypothetical protein